MTNLEIELTLDLFRTSLDVARNGRDNALVRITNLDIKYATLTADKAENWIKSVEQSSEA